MPAHNPNKQTAKWFKNNCEDFGEAVNIGCYIVVDNFVGDVDEHIGVSSDAVHSHIISVGVLVVESSNTFWSAFVDENTEINESFGFNVEMDTSAGLFFWQVGLFIFIDTRCSKSFIPAFIARLQFSPIQIGSC